MSRITGAGGRTLDSRRMTSTLTWKCADLSRTEAQPPRARPVFLTTPVRGATRASHAGIALAHLVARAAGQTALRSTDARLRPAQKDAEPDQASVTPADLQSLFVYFASLSEDLHDRFVDSQKLHDVVLKLREKLPGIPDIRQIRETLHACKGETAMPFHLTGDGFQTSLTMTAVTHALERGILMLEDLENHMRPGLVFEMVYELLSACKDYKMQIFLSSHSDELVECALTHPDTDISVYHMGWSDDDMFRLV